MLTTTIQTSTAAPFLQELIIVDDNEISVATNLETERDDQTLLLTLVEEQHRVMGYGLVSNVFSQFLADEVAA